MYDVSRYLTVRKLRSDCLLISQKVWYPEEESEDKNSEDKNSDVASEDLNVDTEAQSDPLEDGESDEEAALSN